MGSSMSRGTFTYTEGGITTEPIPYDATMAQFEEAQRKAQHKAQLRAVKARRKAAKRRRRMVGSNLTAGQWVYLKRAWGCCAYCGLVTNTLQKDCVIPLRSGGCY